MLKKSDIPNIIKTGVILFLITGIAAFVLAAVNSITAPIIKANEEEKQQAAMNKVLPVADSFSDEGTMDRITDESVKNVYIGTVGNEECGYVVITEPMGYGGKITMVVGVDKEGAVTGIDITGQSETAGLGANCSKDEFKSQFVGKTSGIEVVKTGAKDNEVNAITSATITSKAVTKGVNAALDAVKQIEEGKE